MTTIITITLLLLLLLYTTTTLVVIMSGTLCGWSGRPEQSLTRHSFRSYIINYKNTLKTHFISYSYFTD